MKYNTTGINNIAIGYAMTGNRTGSANTVIGYLAMSANQLGSCNVVIGWQAACNVSGFNNTFVGAQAGRNANQTNNTGVGYKSLYSASGQNNVALGSNTLQNNTIGNSNTAVGKGAGCNITTGCNNAFLGYNAQPVNATSCNSITFGNASIATIRAQVTSITALSDCRDKTNIQGIPVGLDFIKDVRPVKFTWNMRDGAKVGQQELGFIAQELDAVSEKYNIGFADLVLKDNPDRLEASPGKMLPIVIKALQELDEKYNALAARIAILEGTPT